MPETCLLCRHVWDAHASADGCARGGCDCPVSVMGGDPLAAARAADRRADDAGRTYRRALASADEAWRAIGGRP